MAGAIVAIISASTIAIISASTIAIILVIIPILSLRNGRKCKFTTLINQMIKASNPEELADGRAQGEMALDEEVPQVKHSAVHNTGVHRNKAVEGLSS